MPQNCKKRPKCYLRKDKKKCLTPNGWIVFLRTSKGDFSSIGEASLEYQKKFKPLLIKLIAEGNKNRTVKETKARYRKAVCNFFYDQMKGSGRNTATNRKKVSAGVSKILKENSIPKTLEIMGAKNTAAALAAKEKAVKKADAKVAAKKKTAELAKAKASDVIKKAIRAAIRAKKLMKEASDAKTTATKSKSRSSSPSASNSAKSTAAKKKTASKKATQQADTLLKSAEKASKESKTASQAVEAAKKEAKKKKDKKVKRQMALLDTTLILGGRGARRRGRNSVKP